MEKVFEHQVKAGGNVTMAERFSLARAGLSHHSTASAANNRVCHVGSVQLKNLHAWFYISPIKATALQKRLKVCAGKANTSKKTASNLEH